MTQYQRETKFLSYLILFDETAERHKLEARIAHAQRDLRCVERAAWFSAMFTAVCAACLFYGTVLLENFPYAQPVFVIKVVCEAGLASLMCLVGFGGLLVVHRWKLNRLRDECRRLARRTPPDAPSRIRGQNRLASRRAFAGESRLEADADAQEFHQMTSS